VPDSVSIFSKSVHHKLTVADCRAAGIYVVGLGKKGRHNPGNCGQDRVGSSRSCV
jgi:hypothetical protein